jgi:hypothetical protein
MTSGDQLWLELYNSPVIQWLLVVNIKDNVDQYNISAIMGTTQHHDQFFKIGKGQEVEPSDFVWLRLSLRLQTSMTILTFFPL